jgi:folate-binding protein YgfZ
MTTDSMSFYDPRLLSLGTRIICPKDSLEIEEEEINFKLSDEDYHIIRTLYCVPEGPDEVKDRLPLNLNFQHLNGISFTKGCYIGQELTQRTYHTGVIRKVAMPFVCAEKLSFTISDESSNIEQNVIIPFQSITRKKFPDLKNKEIKDTQGNVLGKVISSIYNCGIALIDKEKLEETLNPKFLIDDNNTIIYDPLSIWESVRETENINKL